MAATLRFGPADAERKEKTLMKKIFCGKTSSENSAQRECGVSQTQRFAHLAWMDADR